jgi:hypothetical protein
MSRQQFAFSVSDFGARSHLGVVAAVDDGQLKSSACC